MAKIRVSSEFVGLDSVNGKSVLVCLKSFSLFGYDIKKGDSVVLDNIVRKGADVILNDKVWLLPGTVFEGGHFSISDTILDDVYIGADNSCMVISDCFVLNSRIVPSGYTRFLDSSVIGCSFTIHEFNCMVRRCEFEVCDIKSLRDCDGLKIRNAVGGVFGGCGL